MITIFFEILKSLCDKNNTNVTAVCKKITGSTGNYDTWKKGNVRSQDLIAISKNFNVSTDYLLGLSDSPNPVQPIPVITSNERKIINILNRFEGDYQCEFIGRVGLIANDFQKELQANPEYIGEKKAKIA